MLDEMERNPHKRPDDDMARIVAQFAPKISQFIMHVDTMGEDAFQDQALITEFSKYREDYEAVLGEHFDNFVQAVELSPEATEKDKFAARENFVEDTAALNEDDAVSSFAREKTRESSQQEGDSHTQRLQVNFGTLRNIYLHARANAEEHAESWRASVAEREPRTRG